MQALFGSPVGRGAAVSGFNRRDLLTADSSVVMGGIASGVLLRVCLRRVLGFCLRSRHSIFDHTIRPIKRCR